MSLIYFLRAYVTHQSVWGGTPPATSLLLLRDGLSKLLLRDGVRRIILAYR